MAGQRFSTAIGLRVHLSNSHGIPLAQTGGVSKPELETLHDQLHEDQPAGGGGGLNPYIQAEYGGTDEVLPVGASSLPGLNRDVLTAPIAPITLSKSSGVQSTGIVPTTSGPYTGYNPWLQAQKIKHGG